MDIKGFGYTTKEKIKNFEENIGFILPEDYKKKYSGFFLKDLNEFIILDVLCGFEIEELDLYEWNDEYKEDLLEKSIIIGHDPGNGFLILINDSDKQGVYYWDHSYYFDQSNEENNLYKIADSFQEFLKKLK